MKRISTKLFAQLLAIGLAASAFFLGGCATASNSTAMIATSAAPANKHTGSVSVNVTGGAETSAMGASNISNTDFASAIQASITQSQLFAKILAEQSDYRLDVQIVRLDRPMFGTSFTVNLEATWRLFRRGEPKPVWEKAVASSFTATMGDAFAGVTRLRLANEGAARANIKDAIAQMGTLTLP
ncbi:MAG: hypothetical protein JNK23_09710 [Opitutaceae bacterium]|nr:hypothetical protein [Opitutaceae bacterium]